jgi:large subunit ribosomal protein L18
MAMQIVGRERRKLRIRTRISGSAERPRLMGNTVAHASTLSRDVRGGLEEDSKLDAAKKVGKAIAKLLLEKGVDRVVFDRNGYLYHGRIRALAEAAREAGLKF